MPKLSLLIVEDDEAIGLNLAAAAQDVGAAVVGPVGSVAEALDLLDLGGIDGAVIDVRLQDRDVTPVALKLIGKNVPFVIHSGYALPDELAAMYLEPQVVMKPADPETVMNHVLHLVAKARTLQGPAGSALTMMVSALGLLDSQGERLAAVHLQTAIDVLTGADGVPS
jgi:two-component SAPR family response regulator